jgi:CheY-like chemotaxis protein
MSNTKTLLFIEDVYASVAGLYELIADDGGGWMPALRSNVPDAWLYLCQREVQAIVLDVMLPAIDGFESNLEGVYLAALLRGRLDGSPGTFGFPDKLRPSNMAAPICLLTGRTQLTCGACKTWGFQLTGLEDLQARNGDAIYYAQKDQLEIETLVNWLKRIR